MHEEEQLKLIKVLRVNENTVDVLYELLDNKLITKEDCKFVVSWKKYDTEYILSKTVFCGAGTEFLRSRINLCIRMGKKNLKDFDTNLYKELNTTFSKEDCRDLP